MKLLAVENPLKIKQNASFLFRLLKKGSRKRNHRVGWPSGSGFKNVYWKKEESFWTTCERAKNRYWFGYGIENPEIKPKNSSLIMTCEINPSFRGPLRASAGLFATDRVGNIFLCHTGKIGGGRKGIGKKAFVKYVKGMRRAEVNWSDKVVKEVFVIGKVNNSLPKNISRFIETVALFKRKKTGAGIDRFYRGYFNPESTRSTSYERKGRVKPGKLHAIIVNELERRLKQKDCITQNNKNIDLMITIRGGKVDAIFEVKTDNGTSSVYQGIGQLMFHSMKEKKAPHKHLVLPVGLNRKSEKRLRMLDIDVIYYRKRGRKISFYNF